MRITKVYTRTGDKGKTRLAGGQEISKDHPRLETYGTVDELNCIVGLARAFLVDVPETIPQAKFLDGELERIQHRLFDIGSILATAPGQTFPNMPEITAAEVTHLEKLIDHCQKDLKPLEEFILPGGGKVASFLHQARTVCRRAERRCVALGREETVKTGSSAKDYGAPFQPELLQYINRLGDAFFVLSRWIAWAQKTPETLWKRTKS